MTDFPGRRSSGAIPPVAMGESRDTQITGLVLGYLLQHGHIKAMRSLEVEACQEAEVFGKDVRFLRALVLDGRWSDAKTMLEPLRESISSYEQVMFALDKQRFLELLDMQGSGVEAAELVAVLKGLEGKCPAEDFQSLCSCLTLPSVTKHADFAQWTVHRGRMVCFRSVVLHLEAVFPNQHVQRSPVLPGRLEHLCRQAELYEKERREKSLLEEEIIYMRMEAATQRQERATGASTLSPPKTDFNGTAPLQQQLVIQPSALTREAWEQERFDGKVDVARAAETKVQVAEEKGERAAMRESEEVIKQEPSSLPPQQPRQEEEVDREQQQQQQQAKAKAPQTDRERKEASPSPPPSPAPQRREEADGKDEDGHVEGWTAAEAKEGKEGKASTSPRSRSVAPDPVAWEISMEPSPSDGTDAHHKQQPRRGLSSERRRNSRLGRGGSVSPRRQRGGLHPPGADGGFGGGGGGGGCSSYGIMEKDDLASFRATVVVEDKQPIRTARFDPTGRYFAMGSNDSTLKVCALPSTEQLREAIRQADANHSRALRDAGGGEEEEEEEEEERKALPRKLARVLQDRQGHHHHKVSVYCLDWDSTSSLIASGSNDKTVKVMHLAQKGGEPTTTELVTTLVGQKGTIRDVCFSKEKNDPRLLTVGAGDCKCRVWDASIASDNSEPLVAFRGHTKTVFSGVMLPGGCTALTGGADRTLQLWDTRTGGSAVSLPTARGRRSSGTSPNKNLDAAGDILAVAAWPDDPERFVLSSHSDASVVLWDLSERRPLYTLMSHTDEVRGLHLSPQGKWLLSSSFDGKSCVFRLQDDAVAAAAAGGGGGAGPGVEQGAGLFQRGRQQFRGEQEEEQWQSPSLSFASSFRGHAGRVLGARWHPTRPAFLSSSTDCSVLLWAPDS